MSRSVRVVAAVVAAQAALLGIYWLVESRRSVSPAIPPARPTFGVE